VIPLLYARNWRIQALKFLHSSTRVNDYVVIEKCVKEKIHNIETMFVLCMENLHNRAFVHPFLYLLGSYLL